MKKRAKSVEAPSATLRNISDMMRELVRLRSLCVEFYHDTTRLIDRCLIFQPIVEDAVKTKKGRISLHQAELFEDLQGLISDVLVFATQFQHKVMYRTIVRYVIRVSLCEELAALTQRVQSTALSLKLAAAFDQLEAEVRRRQDLEDADLTFRACVTRTLELVHSIGEPALGEFRSLLVDLELNKFYFEDLVELMGHRELSPAELVLIDESNDMLVGDVRRVRAKLMRAHPGQEQEQEQGQGQGGGAGAALVAAPSRALVAVGGLNGFPLLVNAAKALLALLVLVACNLQLLLRLVDDSHLLRE